jgi:acetylornithine deacetylase
MNRASFSDISPERLLSLLRQMLEIYSPSGKETELVQFLQQELADRKLPVTAQIVDDERQNLLVLPKGKMSLCFIGHVDTVPTSDLDSFACTENDGRIFGLGAADMKSGCAAMIEALSVLYHRLGDNCPVGLALLVGEEENGDGAEALLREYQFPYAIVGEPTELMPCLDHFGYLEMTAEVKGLRRHASLADASLHPIEGLLHFTMDLVGFLKTDCKELTYNLRDLTSSQAGFAVPEWAKVSFDIHLPPWMQTPDEIESSIRALHDASRLRFSDLESHLSFPTMVPGYRIREEGPFVDRLKRAFFQCDLPFFPQSFVSHSDANLLMEAGTAPVILGPGSLMMAHAPDECVPEDQVVRAAELYLNIGLSMSE